MRKYNNLSTRYCGSIIILNKIGMPNHRLELPHHIRVQNVFHVSLLKLFVLDTFLRLYKSSPIDQSGSFVVTPKVIL